MSDQATPYLIARTVRDNCAKAVCDVCRDEVKWFLSETDTLENGTHVHRIKDGGTGWILCQASAIRRMSDEKLMEEPDAN